MKTFVGVSLAVFISGFLDSLYTCILYYILSVFRLLASGTL